MRVLIAGDKSIADMPGQLSKAFRARGHDVGLFCFNAAVARLEEATPGGRKVKEFTSHLLKSLFGLSWKQRYFTTVNHQFLRTALEFRPDFILTICGVQLFRETLEHVKGALPVRIANWVVDDPARSQTMGFIATYPVYDILFSCSSSWLDFAKLWDCHVEFLPLATDPEVYTPARDGQGDTGMDSPDVVFVGTFVPGDPSSMFRASTLAGLASRDYTVEIYGRGVAEFARRFPPLRSFVLREGHLPTADVNRLYNRAKIVLNIYNIFNQDVVSLRVFEVACAGGFQLAAYQRDLDHVFPQGMIDVFRSTGDLRQKVEYFLEHPEERRTKAQAAAAYAREFHTYLRRVDQMLELVPGLRS